MKKTPLKKISPAKTLKNKADRSLQDYYRRNFPDLKCVGCGQPFQLMHHYIIKSQSNNLRYDPDNLIPICHQCHSKIHCFGQGQLIEAKIVLERGQKWFDRIKEKKGIHVSYSAKDYQNFIDKYGE